jgi:hypothetical protein
MAGIGALTPVAITAGAIGDVVAEVEDADIVVEWLEVDDDDEEEETAFEPAMPTGAMMAAPLALSFLDLGLTFGPIGNGSGLPIEVPSEWKMSGRHLGSSNIKEEFLKCSIIDILPWILAYEMRHTFSELNFSHFLLSNSSQKAGMFFGSMKLIKAYPTLHRFLKSIGR